MLRAWWRTIRMEMADADRAVITQQGQPVVFALWHNRLFVAPEIFRRFRSGQPISALISASKDGSWLAALFAAVGMHAVRGSSSRQGRQAATGLVEAIQNGRDVGITPDGPRGPAYVMKPGALVVGRRTKCVFVLAGFEYESAWRINSWDGFYLPRPFSTMRLHFENVDLAAVADTDEAVAQLGRRLVEMSPDRIPSPPRMRG
ncbi:MAG TPA: lysophospholipid acyltransferase family protein [Opitutaceae bacterium]|nr:lysophospholipid acyltransferase family protein [Opitutaceae bacterium]